MIEIARNNAIKVITYRIVYDTIQVFKCTCMQSTNLNGTIMADSQIIKETVSRKNPRKKTDDDRKKNNANNRKINPIKV